MIRPLVKCDWGMSRDLQVLLRWRVLKEGILQEEALGEHHVSGTAIQLVTPHHVDSHLDHPKDLEVTNKGHRGIGSQSQQRESRRQLQVLQAVSTLGGEKEQETLLHGAAEVHIRTPMETTRAATSSDVATVTPRVTPTKTPRGGQDRLDRHVVHMQHQGQLPEQVTHMPLVNYKLSPTLQEEIRGLIRSTRG